MKILVLTDKYPPYYDGGYELICQQVTDGLRERGYTLEVLTTTFGVKGNKRENYIYRILHHQSLSSQNIFIRRMSQLKNFFQASINYMITRRLAKKISPDLVFVWHAMGISILPILAIQDLGISTVLNIGSHWLYFLRERYVEEPSILKRWYRSSLIGFRKFEELELDAIIMVSEKLKKSYHNAGFDVVNAVVIPTGIPHKWIARQPFRSRLPESSVRILYVGRLEPAKGPDIAIRSVENLVKSRRYRNVYLDMIGSGNAGYMDELNQLIVQNNLQKVVKLIGFLSRSELIQRYSQYDMLLFPTPRFEGLPMTIIEAMANGLTVIASDIGGPSDIIEDGRNGFLVTPGDPVSMADKIEKIIINPSLAAEIGLSAIETVRKKYTLDNMLKEYENYLKKFVS